MALLPVYPCSLVSPAFCWHPVSNELCFLSISLLWFRQCQGCCSGLESFPFSHLLFPCRMFVAQQIISSNLLLLVTDTVCDCSVFPPVPMDPKEVKYILPCTAGMQGSTGPVISLFAWAENALLLPWGWRACPGLERSPARAR